LTAALYTEASGKCCGSHPISSFSSKGLEIGVLADLPPELLG